MALGFPLHFDWSWRTLFNREWEDVQFFMQGGSEEFRTVFEVEQGRVAAGCVRWVDDREIQDLLLATGAFAATVDAQDPRRPVIRLVLEDAQLDAVKLAIEWTARMRTLAREGVAATPGH